MKRFTLILLLTICFQSILFTQNIQELTNITHNRMVVDYDQYTGSINRYGNRLFINTVSKIEEALILDDGSLERISFTERGYTWGVPSFIDEEKFYSFYCMNGYFQMMIFDLSTVPMSYLTTIEIPLAFTLINFVPQVIGEHIILSNNNSTILKFNKNTLTVDDVFTGLLSVYAIKDSTIIVANSFYNEYIFIDFVLRFYDYTTASTDNPFGELINDLFLDLDEHNRINYLKVIDNLLYVICWDYIAIYDITDLANVYKVFSITDDGNTIYTDALIYDNFIITYHSSGLHIYNIADFNNIHRIYEENLWPSAAFLPLNIYNDKLFVNSKDNVVTYDLLDGFNKIAQYGNSISDYKYTDAYLIDNSRYLTEIKIYSLLEDNPEIITIQSDEEPGIYRISNFAFKENQIFTTSSKGTNEYYFDIYELTNNGTELIYRFELEYNADNIRIYGDNIIITQPRGTLPSHNYVYEFSDNELSYLGMFSGMIGENSGYSHDEYFIVLTSNSLDFHEKSFLINVIHSQPHLHSSMRGLRQVAENTISYENNEIQYIFNYDDSFNYYTQTFSHYYPNEIVNFYNGYMVTNDIWSSLTKFYRIDNGIPHQIGELDIHKTVNVSFIFPEHNKLILRCLSGIHVYDIEYTVSESDQVVEYKRESFVYPNPVNSGEVNFKTTLNTSQMEISIYNVKGQLVKRSKDFQSKDGDMTFSWNKKNEQNQTVASGVYFYKIKTDVDVQTGKFLIIK